MSNIDESVKEAMANSEGAIAKIFDMIRAIESRLTDLEDRVTENGG